MASNKTTNQQFDIYWARMDPAEGSELKKTRPVVIVSPNLMNQYLETVVICPLTTTIHPQWRSRISIDLGNQKAEIAIDQIRTISKNRLKDEPIETLNSSEQNKLQQLITELYGNH